MQIQRRANGIGAAAQTLWSSALCLALWALSVCSACSATDADAAGKGAAGVDDLARAAAEFAARAGKAVRQVFFDASCIDPRTGLEERERRRQLRKRQRELSKWLNARGRNVRWQDCVTPTDRRNYREYPGHMANARLLALPYGKRRALVREVDAYFADFARLFAKSLEGVVGNGVASSGPNLRRCLATQLAQHLTVTCRFLNRTGGSVTAALYLPESSELILNLNRMAEDPAEFIDTFEHELWHHLLPFVGPGRVGHNVWWEGFNEAVTEMWAASLNRLRERGEKQADGGVEYPVQVALASLFLGVHRAGTLEWLAAGGECAELDAHLTERAVDAEPRGRLRSVLAARHPLGYAVSPEEQRRVEAVLTQWRWKEDDGSRISIAHLLVRERLDAPAIDDAFRVNRRFLKHVIDALTLVRLQDLREECPVDEILSEADLPALLASNLERVLRYVRDPVSPLPGR